MFRPIGLTLRAAPSKVASQHFFDVASTPPQLSFSHGRLSLKRRILSILFQRHLVLVTFGKDGIFEGPVDSEIGIVPSDPAFICRLVELALLVLNFADV